MAKHPIFSDSSLHEDDVEQYIKNEMTEQEFLRLLEGDFEVDTYHIEQLADDYNPHNRPEILKNLNINKAIQAAEADRGLKSHWWDDLNLPDQKIIDLVNLYKQAPDRNKASPHQTSQQDVDSYLRMAFNSDQHNSMPVIKALLGADLHTRAFTVLADHPNPKEVFSEADQQYLLSEYNYLRDQNQDITNAAFSGLMSIMPPDQQRKEIKDRISNSSISAKSLLKNADESVKNELINGWLGITGGQPYDPDLPDEENFDNWEPGEDYNEDAAREIARSVKLTPQQAEHIYRHGTLQDKYNMFHENSSVDPTIKTQMYKKWRNDDHEHGYDIDDYRQHHRENADDVDYELREQAEEQIRERYPFDEFLQDHNYSVWEEALENGDLDAARQAVIEEEFRGNEDTAMGLYDESILDEVAELESDLRHEKTYDNALSHPDNLPSDMYNHPSFEERRREIQAEQEENAYQQAIDEEDSLSGFHRQRMPNTYRPAGENRHHYAQGQHFYEMARDAADQRGGAVDIGTLNKQYPNLKDTWKKIFAGKGKISSEELDQKIDDLPRTRYRISYGKWADHKMQNVNNQDQTIVRLDHSPDSIEQIKNAGAYDTFKHIAELSQRSGHPTNINTIAWARVDTSNPEHWFIDEVQSDYASTARDYLKQHGKEESAADLQKIMDAHGDWRETLMNHVIKTAKQNGVNKISTHSPESKASHTGSSKVHSVYKDSYKKAPRRMGFKASDGADLPLTPQGIEVFGGERAKGDENQRIDEHLTATLKHLANAHAYENIKDEHAEQLGFANRAAIDLNVSNSKKMAKKHHQAALQIDPTHERARKIGQNLEPQRADPTYLGEPDTDLGTYNTSDHDAKLERKVGKLKPGHTLDLTGEPLKKSSKIQDRLNNIKDLLQQLYPESLGKSVGQITFPKILPGAETRPEQQVSTVTEDNIERQARGAKEQYKRSQPDAPESDPEIVDFFRNALKEHSSSPGEGITVFDRGPQKMIGTYKGAEDATSEYPYTAKHEGLHRTIGKLAEQTGYGYDNIYNAMNQKIPSQQKRLLHNFLDAIGTTDEDKHIEMVTYLRDALVRPDVRKVLFSIYDNPKKAQLMHQNMKKTYKHIRKWAKNLTPEQLASEIEGTVSHKIANLQKSSDGILQHHHIMMSPENPIYDQKIKISPKQAKRRLEQMGEKVEVTRGRYGDPETSFIIHNPKNVNKIKDFAKKLGQEAIVESKGGQHQMHYLHGENAGMKHIGSGTEVFDHPPEDYYTEVSTPAGKKYVRHQFDFDKLHPSEPDRATKSKNKLLSDRPGNKTLKKADDDSHYDLVHFSMKPGLDTLSPLYQDSGAAGEEKLKAATSRKILRHLKQKGHDINIEPAGYLHTYMADTGDPEPVFRSAPAKYHIRVPKHKIYDLSTDPEGVLKHVKQKHSKVYAPAESVMSHPDLVHNEIKDRGYLGWTVSKHPSDRFRDTVQLYPNMTVGDPKSEIQVRELTDKDSPEWSTTKLHKGAGGDWKSEGYELYVMKHDKHPNKFTVYAHHPDHGDVGFTNFEKTKHGLVPDDDKGIGMATYVDKDHRRKGLASAMYQRAEKHAKMAVKPSETQSESGEKLWQQKNRKFGDLEKGAARRKFPFNPSDVPYEDRKIIEDWTYNEPGMHESDVHLLPRLTGNARQRALLKLHRIAPSRKNPETGKREFLLHRGLTARDISEGGIGKGERGGIASYSASPQVARDFNDWATDQILQDGPEALSEDHPIIQDWFLKNPPKEAEGDLYDQWQEAAPLLLDKHVRSYDVNKIHSAWVPEDAIHHIPNILGSRIHGVVQMMDPDEKQAETPERAHRHHEHEVVVDTNKIKDDFWTDTDNASALLDYHKDFAKQRSVKKPDDLEKGAIKKLKTHWGAYKAKKESEKKIAPQEQFYDAKWDQDENDKPDLKLVKSWRIKIKGKPGMHDVKDIVPPKDKHQKDQANHYLTEEHGLVHADNVEDIEFSKSMTKSDKISMHKATASEIPEEYLYVAMDGDSAGSQVERAALRNDLNAIRDISNRIHRGSKAVLALLRIIDPGSRVIIRGGDDIGFLIHKDKIKELDKLRSIYRMTAKFTITAGVADSIPKATRALLYGKLTGKNKSVLWQPEVDKMLQNMNTQQTQEEKVSDILKGTDDATP